MSSKIVGSDLAIALALFVLGVLLLAAGAGLAGQWEDAAARNGTVSVDSLLGIASALAGTALLGWWLLSLLAAGVVVLLENRGIFRGAAAARKLSPAFMQRLVIAAVSVQLVSGAAANASTEAPGPQWAPTQQYAASAPAAQGGTANAAEPPKAGGTVSSAVPGPAAPAATAAATSRGLQETPPASVGIQPGWRPSAQPVAPGLLATAPARPEAFMDDSGRRRTGTVAVLSGDTLWDIVANHLGPDASDVEIALEWPRWYDANRTLIGPDPDVLLPGQVLQPPAPA